MGNLNKNTKRKLTDYFMSRLGMFEYRRGWLKGDCPSCGKQFKFGVNISQNRTNCFYCKYNKRPFDVMMDIERITDYNEARLFLSKFDGRDFVESPTLIEEKFSAEENKTLPDGFKLITDGKSQLARSARKYLEGRGFDIKELARSGWGYGTEGDYFGYIIIPFYQEGKMKYFITRAFMSNGPKFNNPKADDYGIGKSMLIYNVDCLQIYKTVYIVESVMNAKTLGDNAIAIDGKKISRYQLNVLIKSSVERFIIILDPDAYQEAIELAIDLFNYKMVKVVKLPDGVDVNDIGRKRTLHYVYKNRYLSYTDLIQKKFQNETA